MKRIVCFHSDVDFGVTTHLVVALFVLGQLLVGLVLVDGANVGDAKAVDARLPTSRGGGGE